MTNKQGLDPAEVVRAALRLLDDKGAAAVSVRGVAELLGVRMNTVLWHVRNKARLLELMADAITAGASLDDLPARPDERARDLAYRYRRALLAHRDGAVIVAGTYAAEPATLRFADALIAALLDTGLPERDAAWTAWSVIYFTLGLTQEEQAAPDAVSARLTERLDPSRHPALARVATHFVSGTFDDRFEHGLSLLLRNHVPPP
ncbi:transcriptional regulator [Actinomadura sp. CNU-125]|uniref:TetR/AcrR family transcriptional regulator C-terminal domain-containing protein n=1 Tax=Actinomadura sp. CNU-125 TaxID=1904961 RepID=UPI00095B15C7|nr:TetR/AcrR family transcriptional regulator C-terminal domain-containing protein [Actinomadura sp. CNU-125]OLT33202.1 transcriptional regulator [Actinomadura sp. CNU-125]